MNKSKLHNFNGAMVTAAQIAKELQRSVAFVNDWLRVGWSVEKIQSYSNRLRRRGNCKKFDNYYGVEVSTDQIMKFKSCSRSLVSQSIGKHGVELGIRSIQSAAKKKRAKAAEEKNNKTNITKINNFFIKFIY